jgi:hypothetical protein
MSPVISAVARGCGVPVNTTERTASAAPPTPFIQLNGA